jgi:tRNA(Arg) A34 adenosine deaminase TadA
LALLLGCAGLLWLFLRRTRRPLELTEAQRSRLLAQAEQSLEALDVPVGALLLYDGEIIGEGHNTVLRDGIAGGHAEINALSGAIRSLGMERFMALDRDRLLLVSTFEPCPMCAGAFSAYGLRRVCFLKPKAPLFRAREWARVLRYLLQRRRGRDSGEQDRLFARHPQYPGNKVRGG